jgi:hypothetical protein
MPKEPSVVSKGKGKGKKGGKPDAELSSTSAGTPGRYPLLDHPISLKDGTQVNPQVRSSRLLARDALH